LLSCAAARTVHCIAEDGTWYGEFMRGVAIVLLVGCIQPAPTQTCGDAICPADQVCLADEMRCVSQTAVAACAGSAAGAQCDPLGICTMHGDRVVCDPSTCGDGVIDPRLAEQCDGSASFATQCIDLDFDLGRPRCNDARCEFDTSTCERFGWTSSVSASVYAMWSDGWLDGVRAYATYNPSQLTVTGGGYQVAKSISITAIDGYQDRIVVLSCGAVYQVGTNDVLPLGTGGPNNIVALAVAHDAARGVYAISDCGAFYASFIRYDDANGWVTLNNQVPCSQLATNNFKIASSSSGQMFVYIEPQGSVSVWNGSGFTMGPSSLQQVGQLAAHTIGGSEYVFAAAQNGLIQIDPSDLSKSAKQLSSHPVATLAFTSSEVLAADPSTATGLRWANDSTDTLDLPAGMITDDGHDHVLAYGGSIYLYDGKTFGALPPPPLMPGDTVVDALANGLVFGSSSSLLVFAGDSWSTSANPCGSFVTEPRAFAGSSPTDFVVSDTTGVWWFQPTTCQQIAGVKMDSAYGASVDGLWVSPSGEVFAAGSKPGPDAFLGFWKNSTWNVPNAQNAGCTAFGVSGTAFNDVYAVGQCGGEAAFWYFDGTGWSAPKPIAGIAGPLERVLVFASGEVFAIGESGAAWCRLASCSDPSGWASDASVVGRSIAGTTPTDVWVSGNFTTIQHWDGNNWSGMTTRSLGPTVLSASPGRVLMPGGTPGHVSLLRTPL